MRGRCRVIAIKQSIELVPWADVVYGCDAAWWIYRKGLPEFGGLKVCYDGNKLQGYPDIRRIEIEGNARRKEFTDRILVGKPGLIGSGRNSGFQALNLAVQWGAKRILLIGFDMTDNSGVHWYGRNGWHMANNPDQSCFPQWIAAFDAAVPVLADLGVEVINCSVYSAMKSFPRRSIDDALRDWT